MIKFPNLFKFKFKNIGDNLNLNYNDKDILTALETYVASYVSQGSFNISYTFNNIKTDCICEQESIIVQPWPDTSSIFYREGFIKTNANNIPIIANNISEFLSATQTAIEPDSTFIHINYQNVPIEHGDQILFLKNAFSVLENQQLFFPANNYLLVASGSALINDNIKAPKTAILSSKDQTINVSSTNTEKTILFLMTPSDPI